MIWNIKDKIFLIRFWAQRDKRQLDEALETLRQKLVEDFFTELEYLPYYNDEELRKMICAVINKRFGVEKCG